MIVKVKNEENGWSYFECEILHSRCEEIGEIKNKVDAVILLKKGTLEVELNKDIFVNVLNLETKESHLRTVITNNPCYILNREGKTIDKI